MVGFQPLYGDYMVIIWWFIGVLMEEPNYDRWEVPKMGGSPNSWVVFLGETPRKMAGWPHFRKPHLRGNILARVRHSDFDSSVTLASASRSLDWRWLLTVTLAKFASSSVSRAVCRPSGQRDAYPQFDWIVMLAASRRKHLFSKQPYLARSLNRSKQKKDYEKLKKEEAY